MRLFPRVVACLVVCLISCAHAVAPAPANEGTAAWYGDLHALAAEAAQVRGTTLTQSFEVMPLDDAAFFEVFKGFLNSKQSELVKEIGEAFAALSLAKEGLPALRSLTAQQATAVRDEQLIAFYLFEQHRMYVRRVLPPALAGQSDLIRLGILAHEVGHVLQDQHGLLKLDQSTFESALAFRAAMEGDATLTAILLMAKRNRIPPARAVERVRFMLVNLDARDLIELSGVSPVLLRSPALLRDMLVFPYVEGQAFVADLYAAGGLPLVDEMLKAPPLRTESIWMPQRWLDGADAKVGVFGAAPHKLGTLVAKGFLEQCGQTSGSPAPPGLLTFISRHLMDDSFQRTGNTLVWATAWDSDSQHARDEAKDMLNRLASCIGAQPGSYEVMTEGPVAVLSVRAPEEARRVARLSLLPAPAPSLGHRRVPKARIEVAYKMAGAGEVVGERWVHKRLGLSLDGLAGVKILASTASVLTLTAPGALLFASFADEPVNEKGRDAFVNVSLNLFLKRRQLGPKEYSLSARHAWNARKWGEEVVQVTDEQLAGEISVRAIAAPLCGGKSAFYVMALALEPRGRPRLDDWTNGWKVSPAAPICSER